MTERVPPRPLNEDNPSDKRSAAERIADYLEVIFEDGDEASRYSAAARLGRTGCPENVEAAKQILKEIGETQIDLQVQHFVEEGKVLRQKAENIILT